MQQPGLGRGSCAPVMDTVSPVELQTKVREDFTITEMAYQHYSYYTLSTRSWGLLHDCEIFAKVGWEL